jgi:hypothetical protein
MPSVLLAPRATIVSPCASAEPVAATHAQRPLLDDLESFLRRTGLDHHITGLFKLGGNGVPYKLLVLDDENRGGEQTWSR